MATPVLDMLEGSDSGHDKDQPKILRTRQSQRIFPFEVNQAVMVSGGRSLSLSSVDESYITHSGLPRRSKSDTTCPSPSVHGTLTNHCRSCLDDDPTDGRRDWTSYQDQQHDSSWCEKAINAPCFTPTSIWTPTVADSASTDEYQPQYYGEVDAHPHLHRRRSPSHTTPPTLSEGGGGYMYYSTVRTPAQSSLPSPLNCTTPSGTAASTVTRSKTPLYISDHLPDVVTTPPSHPRQQQQEDSSDITRFRGQLRELGVHDPQEQLVTARLLITTAKGVDELSRRLGRPVVGELMQLLLSSERALGEGASSNIESTPSTADEELLPVGLLEIE